MGVVGLARLLGVGMVLHAKQMSRSPLEIALSLIEPLVFATMAVYLFRAAGEPHALVEAAVGAGLMGVWSSVLFGSGGAVQNQRWLGTLELLMLAPRRPVWKYLPITLATALVGTYAVVATLAWGRLGFGIRLDIANPFGFVAALVTVILGLGMMGLLLASTFILMPNANALANTLSYPVWALSGMLVSLTVLPGWTAPISAALPTTWGARAVREAVTGGPVWPSLTVSLVQGLACLAVGSVAMSWMERRARVAATLGLA
jgi:ABC-2 type transport system permease protein